MVEGIDSKPCVVHDTQPYGQHQSCSTVAKRHRVRRPYYSSGSPPQVVHSSASYMACIATYYVLLIAKRRRSWRYNAFDISSHSFSWHM